MFKDEYRKELNKLTASEKFKQDTISLMQEKQAILEQNNKKEIHFKPKQTARIAASVAVLALALGTYAFTHSDFAISMDSAETEKTSYTEEIKDASTDKFGTDEEFNDSLSSPAQQANRRIYTINDIADLTETVPQAKVESEISFSTQHDGGMGFESLMFYDINEIATENPFDATDTFSTLSVYEYNEITYEQAYAEVMSILDKQNKSEKDITRIECSWSDVPDVYMGNATTYDFSVPDEDAKFSFMNVKFDGGKIDIFPSGIINLDLYTSVPEFDSNAEAVNYTIENYSYFAESQLKTYTVNDYSRSGEQIFSNYYYVQSDNYSDNLLNYSVNDMVFSYIEEDEFTDEYISIRYLHKGTYSWSAELPAISYSQALGLLYDGEYHTSVPVAVDENSVVSKIELVYKEPPRNYQTMVKEGWAVPFYKFYVRLADETATEKGNLNHYGVYYVCAIHPEYIELTDEYIQFNGD